MTKLTRPAKRLIWDNLPMQLQEKVLRHSSTFKVQEKFSAVSRAQTQQMLHRHAPALAGLTPAAQTLHAWVRAQAVTPQQRMAWSAVLEAPANTPLAQVKAQAKAVDDVLQAFNAALEDDDGQQGGRSATLDGLLLADSLGEEAGTAVRHALLQILTRHFTAHPGFSLRYEPMLALQTLVHHTPPEQRIAVVAAARGLVWTAAEASLSGGEAAGPAVVLALRNLRSAPASRPTRRGDGDDAVRLALYNLDAQSRTWLLHLNLAALDAQAAHAAQINTNLQHSASQLHEREITLAHALDLADSLVDLDAQHSVQLVHHCLQALQRGVAPRLRPRLVAFAQTLCAQAVLRDERAAQVMWNMLLGSLDHTAPETHTYIELKTLAELFRSDNLGSDALANDSLV